MPNRIELLGYPTVEWTANGTLRRITRSYKVIGPAVEVANIGSEVFLPYGTPDEEYATAVLVQQRVDRVAERAAELRLTRVYQELATGALTETGEETEQDAWDRRTIRRKVYLCLASEADALTPAIGSQLGTTGFYLFDVQVQVEGIAARLTCSYVSLDAGEFIFATSTQTDADGVKTTSVRSLILEKDVVTLTPVSGPDESLDWSISDGVAVVTRASRSIDAAVVTSTRTETRHSGALTITVQTGVGPTDGTEPTWTGTGVLFESSQDVRGAITVYRRAWASGSGEIGRDTETRFGGALTVTTVHSIGATRVAATNEYEYSRDERDGYTLWTSRGASGTGTIEDTTETRNGGKLTIRTIRSIGAAPSSPGTGYVLVDSEDQSREGYTLYLRRWAKGQGRVSTGTSYRYNNKLVLVTIRYLESDDETTPSGTLVNESADERDGHTLYTRTYAEVVGDGIVLDETERRNGGKLVLRRIRRLGIAPSAPLPAIGGTVVLVSERIDQDDGVEVFDYRWAEGNGTIETAESVSATGVVVSRTITALGSPPTTPMGFYLSRTEQEDRDGVTVYRYTFGNTAAVLVDTEEIRNNGNLFVRNVVSESSTLPTPTGYVRTEFGSRVQSDGRTVYNYTWVKGDGQIAQTITARSGGLRTVEVVSLGTKVTPAGVVTEEEEAEIDGVTRYTVTAVQSASGGDPTSDTMTFQRYVPFTYPGRAKIYNKNIVGVQHAVDVYLDPPVEVDVLATVEVSYQLTESVGTLPYPKWAPNEWATVVANWIGWNVAPISKVQGLRGYRSVDEAEITIVSSSGTDYSIMGSRVYGASPNITGYVKCVGGPPDPGGNTYTLDAYTDLAFVAADGTKYYRKTVIYATIPDQPPLPTI